MKQKQKQINLNEYYALTADTMNIVLLVQTKDKDGVREVVKELRSNGSEELRSSQIKEIE